MTIPVIVTGDDVSLLATLKKDDATFTIDPGATVKAALVSHDHTEVYTDAVVQSSASPGADWANSLVQVIMDGDATSSIAVADQGAALLEVQVDETIKETWFGNVQIIKGQIA